MPHRALTLCAALLLLVGYAAPAFAKPEFPAELDQRCASAGRLPANPAELARAAQPVLGDCALCHAFDFALGQFPSGGNVSSDGRGYPGDLDPFCVLPDPNQPPTLAPIGNQGVDEGQLLSLLLMAQDGDGDPLAFSVTPLPAGARFVDAGAGMASFDWTPASDQVGSHTLTFSVTDGLDTASESIVVVVAAADVPPPPQANRPPLLAPTPDVLADLGEEILLRFQASDPDGDVLRFGVAGLPDGAVFTDLGGGTAELSFLPEVAGQHLVVVSVMDDGVPPLSAEDDFLLEVPPALPPVGDLAVERADWKLRRGKLRVRGSGAGALAAVEVREAATGALLGLTHADELGGFALVRRPFVAPCAIEVRSGDTVVGPIAVEDAPASCGERLLTRVDRLDWSCRKGRLRVVGRRAPALGEVEILDAAGDLLGRTGADARGRFRTRLPLDAAPEAVTLELPVGDEVWQLGPLRVRETRGCRSREDDRRHGGRDHGERGDRDEDDDRDDEDDDEEDDEDDEEEDEEDEQEDPREGDPMPVF